MNECKPLFGGGQGDSALDMERVMASAMDKCLERYSEKLIAVMRSSVAQMPPFHAANLPAAPAVSAAPAPVAPAATAGATAATAAAADCSPIQGIDAVADDDA